MIFTSVVSILDALGQFGLKLQMLNILPLYSKGLGWVFPAVAGALVGFIFQSLKNKDFEENITLESDKVGA